MTPEERREKWFSDFEAIMSEVAAGRGKLPVVLSLAWAFSTGEVARAARIAIKIDPRLVIEYHRNYGDRREPPRLTVKRMPGVDSNPPAFLEHHPICLA